MSERNTTSLADDSGLNADPIESYVEYNKSRELEIIRNGPINGAVINVSSICSLPKYPCSEQTLTKAKKDVV